MKTALLFATEAAPDGSATALLAADGRTVLDRFVAQLREQGIEDITVVTRPAWAGALRGAGHTTVESDDIVGDLAVIGAVITRTEGAMVLASADIVAHTTALVRTVGPRVGKTLAAVQAGPTARTGAHGQPVMRERDLIISVGTYAHDVTRPNAVFRAVLNVTDADRDRLKQACADVRTYAATHGKNLDEVAGGYGAVGLALLGLVRTGTTVASYNVLRLFMLRVDGPELAERAIAALATVDEAKVASRLGIKEDDEFLATYLVNSYTPKLAAAFIKRGITPTQVTWMSTGVGALAALAFAGGGRALWILGAILMYASFALDCTDGNVARLTGKFSRYGGWLDMIADRAKEYLIFAGLAIGGERHGQHNLWALALTAMVAQTVRHMIDTWYGALQDTATRALPEVPLDSRLDRLGLRAGSGGAGDRLGQLSAAAHNVYRSPAYWLKRSVVLPIGDRWLLIAVTAAFFTPRTTFIVLLVAIALAFAYVLLGRSLRALSMKVAVMPRFNVAYQRDDGPVAMVLGRALPKWSPLVAALPGLAVSLIGLVVAMLGGGHQTWLLVVAAVLTLGASSSAPHTGALDWLVTAALRAAEYTFIVLAGVTGGVPLPLVYALLAVLVLYHYDLTGRIEKQATPARFTVALRGWDIRVIVLAAAVLGGVAVPVFSVGTAYIALVFLGGATYGWWQGLSSHA